MSESSVRSTRQSYARGDVWWAELDPVVGHEQGGRRPNVIVSTDDFNALGVGMVIVVPVTTSDLGYPTHLRLPSGAGGLDKVSYAMAEQVRALSVGRLSRRSGRLDAATMRELTFQLLIMLDA